MVILQFFEDRQQTAEFPVIYRVGHAQVTFDYSTLATPYNGVQAGNELCRILNSDHRAIKHSDINMGICQISARNQVGSQIFCYTAILKVSGDKIFIDSVSEEVETVILPKGATLFVKGYFHL